MNDKEADELDVARARIRTALAWRRTALGLVALSLAVAKLADVTSTAVPVTIAVVALVSASVLITYAERGVHALPSGGHRPVGQLLFGSVVVVTILALTGVVMTVSA